MRIAVLTRDFPPAIGGIPTHVGGLVKGLRALGVNVDVYVGKTDQGTLLLPLTLNLRGYDLVHVQSAPYGAFVSGVPLVVTVHAPILEEWPDYAGLRRYTAVPAYPLERLSLLRARSILAVSETTKQSLVRSYHLPGSKVMVIGNGVELEGFEGSSGTPRVPNRILMVSRLEPRKNVAGALNALSQLPADSYEAQVVGDGSQYASLASLAGALGVNVRFLGRVPRSEIPDLYMGSRVFLTTSRSEGFGLSLIEAMAAGCAVVASDIPAHRALVVNGKTGLIYGSAKELADCLATLLTDASLASRLGANARAVARGFTWESVSRNVVHAYQRALSSR